MRIFSDVREIDYVFEPHIYEDVLTKIVKVINSCVTIEQLDNTTNWVLKLFKNKSIHQMRLNKLIYTPYSEMFSDENSGIVKVLIALIDTKYKELGNNKTNSVLLSTF